MEGAAPSAPVGDDALRSTGADGAAPSRFARAGGRVVILMLFDRVDACPFNPFAAPRLEVRTVEVAPASSGDEEVGLRSTSFISLSA